MTIEELKNMKISLGLTNRDIAERSGIPLGTVQKIFAGVTSAPRRKTLLAIENTLKSTYSYDNNGDRDFTGDGVLKDSEVLYSAKNGVSAAGVTPSSGHQGNYTLDDFYALASDKRVELIDGIIYDMTAPVPDHQTIALQIANQLLPCMEKHKKCQVFLSPIDVQLDCDDKTMVEPDLVVLCDPSKNRARSLYGAPDLIMEILSPSTREKDMFLKPLKYSNAGCREYWIVDLDNQRVIVYLFGEDPLITMYTFDDKVPVGISEGECEVDFSKIKDRLSWGHAE